MTGLAKQAKTLTDTQVRALVRYAETETRFPERNRVVVLLSFKAGLRVKEIAGLTWGMVTDAEGTLTDAIRLTNVASKGKRGGREIYLNPELRDALVVLLEHEQKWSRTTPTRGTADGYVVTLAKGNTDLLSRARSVQFLFNGKGKQLGWYEQLGYAGATSHSGRRTFLTKASRMIHSLGGNLKDVQRLAGHASLTTTQRYFDENEHAKAELMKRI